MSMNITFHLLTVNELPSLAATQSEAGWRMSQMLCVKTDDGIDMIYTFMKDSDIQNYMIRSVQKDQEVPSITDVYLNAFFYENEAHDLYGITITGMALDFAGMFYTLSSPEPMTIISPAQKEAREKAARIAAAKAAKAAKEGRKEGE